MITFLPCPLFPFSFLAAFKIFSSHFSSHIFLRAPPFALPLRILQHSVLEQAQGNQMCGQMGGVEKWRIRHRQGKKVILYKHRREEWINILSSRACWKYDNEL